MKNTDKETEVSDDPDKTGSSANGKTRSRSRKNRSRGSKTSDRDDTSASVNTSGSLLLSAAADPVGLTKKDFTYNLKSSNMAPPLIIQEVHPLTALYGWSTDAPTSKPLGDSTDDIDNPVNWTNFTSTENPVFTADDGDDSVLFAQGPITQDFTNLVWPSYSALFESGLKDNVDISLSTFIRLVMTTHAIYSVIMSFNVVIDLWKQASDNPTNELSRLVLKYLQFGTKQVMQAKTRAALEALTVKISHMPVMPEMVLETRRMLTPFVDPALPESLIMTIHPHALETEDSAFTMGLEKFLTHAHAVLDLTYSKYHDEIATLKTFIPTTVLSESATVAGNIGMDPIRAVGRYNSGMSEHANIITNMGAGTTDLLTNFGYDVSLEGSTLLNNDFTNPGKVIAGYNALRQSSGSSSTNKQSFINNRFFYTIGEAISFIEVLSASVFYQQFDSNLANQVGRVLVTPSTWLAVYILDDTQDSSNSDIPESITSVKIKGANKIYSEILFRRIGINLCTNSGNQAYTKFSHYKRGVLDPNNLRASLMKIAPFLFNLPGVQTLDVAQAGKFITPTSPGVRDAYKSR